MTPTTLTALKSSIAHWKRMQADRKCGERPTASDCALCAKFYPEDCYLGDECKGCPIYEKTGKRFCGGTPYYNAVPVFLNGTDAEWKLASQAMIDFLESLLPDGERDL